MIVRSALWLFLAAACVEAPARVPVVTDASTTGDALGACSLNTPCNALPITGGATIPVCTTDAMPIMNGGSIANGMYHLVSAQAFTSNCTGFTQPVDGPTTFFIGDECLESNSPQNGPENFTRDISGNAITLERVCPTSSQTTAAFTATSSELQLLIPNTNFVLLATFQM